MEFPRLVINFGDAMTEMSITELDHEILLAKHSSTALILRAIRHGSCVEHGSYDAQGLFGVEFGRRQPLSLVTSIISLENGAIKYRGASHPGQQALSEGRILRRRQHPSG